PAPPAPPLPALPATSGSTAEPSGPRPVGVRTPEVENAGSNRNSLSGPRHTPLDTRPANDRVSPLTPGAPNAPVGTHTNNPGNLPQRSAPGSTGSPFVFTGHMPAVFPTASASHLPSECRRVAPPAAGRSSSPPSLESLPRPPPRLGLTPPPFRW